MLYKRFSLIFLLTITAFSGLLFGCGENNYDDLSVSLSETELTLYLSADEEDESGRNRATFEVSVEGAADGVLKTVSYSFSETNIISLRESTDEDGNITVFITAIQPGSTEITVLTDEGSKKSSLTVNVIQEASAIEFNNMGPVYVEQGATKILNANDLLNFYPENTNQKTVSYEIETPYTGVTVSVEGVIEVEADAPTGTFTVVVRHEKSISGSEVNENLETEFDVTIVKPLVDTDLEIDGYTDGDVVELASNIPSESMVNFDVRIAYLDVDITTLDIYTQSNNIVSAGIDTTTSTLFIYGLNAGQDTVCVELSINNSDYVVTKYIPVNVKTYPTEILINERDSVYWDNNPLYVYDNYIGITGQELKLEVNPITAFNTAVKVKISDDDKANINILYEDGSLVNTYADDADKASASALGNNKIYVVASDSAVNSNATIYFVSDVLNEVVTEVNVVLVKAVTSCEIVEDVNVIANESAEFGIVITPGDAYINNTILEIGDTSIANAGLIFSENIADFKLRVDGIKEGETWAKIIMENGLETIVDIKVYNYLSDAEISIDPPSRNSYVGQTGPEESTTFNEAPIEAKTATLAVGSVVELETRKIPADATIDRIEYSSSDEAMVKVTTNGNIISLNKTTEPVLITVNVYGRKTFSETVGEITVVHSAYEKVITKYMLVETYVPIQNISLNATNLQLYDYSELGYFDKADALFSLNVNISPANATYQDITWSNSNTSFINLYDNTSDLSELEEFLDFEGDGYIKADLPNFTNFSSNFGITTVSVRVNEFSKSYVQSCTITIVRPEPVSEITVSDDYLYFDARDGFGYDSMQQVTANALPVDAYNTNLIFKHIRDPFDENTDPVVSVDEFGHVTPLRGGVATIRVIAEDSYTSSYEYTNYVDILVRVADGTIENPYEVKTIEQLQEIELLMDKHYVLGSDIDASSINWTSLGINEDLTITPFTGSLNGTFSFGNITKEYKIIGLDYEISKDDSGLVSYAGLFAINNGIIKNLNIEAQLQDTYDVNGLNELYVGGIAAKSNGEINNAFVNFKAFNLDISSAAANPNFNLYVGGIAGLNDGIIGPENLSELDPITIGVTTSIEETISQYSASESYENEGINFYTSAAMVVEILNNINGEVYVGGVAGYSNGEIARMSTAGEIIVICDMTNVDDYLGGIVGYSTANLTNVYSSSIVKGNYTVGGIAGYMGANIENAVIEILDRTYFTEDAVTQIFGLENVGGLVGIAESMDITNSYVRSYFTRELSALYEGDIVVDSNASDVNVGGLVGKTNETVNITTSYASVNIQVLNNAHDANVGGLVGQTYATGANEGVNFTNTYSTGNILVNGNFTAGGLVGFINESSTAVVVSEIQKSYTTTVLPEVIDAGNQDSGYFVGTFNTTEAESYLVSDAYSLQDIIDRMELDALTYDDEMKSISFYETSNYVNPAPVWSITDNFDENITENWYINYDLNNGYPMLVIGAELLYIDMPTALKSEILPTPVVESETDYGYSHIRIDELVDADDTTSTDSANDYRKAVIFLYEENGERVVVGEDGTNPNIYDISDIVATISLTQSSTNQRYTVATVSENADDVLKVLDNGTLEVYGEGVVTLSISSILNRNVEDIVQIAVIKGFDSFDLVGVSNGQLSIRKEDSKIVSPNYETEEDSEISENVGVFYDTDSQNIDLTINGSEVILSDDDYTNDIVYGSGTQIVESGETVYTGDEVKPIIATPLFNISFYNEQVYIDVDGSGDYDEAVDLTVIENDINGIWSDGDIIDNSLVATDYFKIDGGLNHYIDLNNNDVYDANEPLWIDEDTDGIYNNNDEIDYDYSLAITLNGFELVEEKVYLNEQAENFDLNVYQGAYYVTTDVEEITIGLATQMDVDVFIKTDTPLDIMDPTTAIITEIQGDLAGDMINSSSDDYVELAYTNIEQVYEDAHLAAIPAKAVLISGDEYYLDLDDSGTQGEDEPVWTDTDTSGDWSTGDVLEDGNNYKIYKFTYSIKVKDTYLDYSNGENTFKEAVSGSIKFTSNSTLNVYDSFALTILPEDLLRIDMNHFPGGETYSGAGEVTYYPKENATDTIAPGRAGVLKINLYPEYANVDYYEITSTVDSNEQAILFEQLAFNGAGYTALDLSGSAIDNGIRLKLISNKQSDEFDFDGNLYVRTLLSSNVPIGTNFIVTIKAFKDGVATGASQKVTLEAQHLPGVNLTYEGSKFGYVAVGTGIDLELTASEDYEGEVNLYVSSKIPSGTNYAALGYASFEDCEDAYQNYVTVNEVEETLTVNPFALLGTEVTVLAEVIRVVNGIEEKNSSEIKLIITEFVVEEITVDSLNTSADTMNLLVGVKKALNANLVIDSFSVEAWFDGTAAWSEVSDAYKIALHNSIFTQDGEKWSDLTALEQTDWLTNSNSYFDGNVSYDELNPVTQGLYQDLIEVECGLVEGVDDAEIADYTNLLISILEKRQTLELAINTSFNYWQYIVNKNGVNYATVLDDSEATVYNEIAIEKDNHILKVKGKTVSTTARLGVFANITYSNATGIVGVTSQNSDISIYKEKTFRVDVSTNTSEDNPIPIYNVEDFESMIAGENYRLMNDIELDNWVPMNTAITSLDGNSKVITINTFAPFEEGTEMYVGLFSTISENTVLKNLKVDITPISEIDLSDYSEVIVGALAAVNEGTIYNAEIRVESLEIITAESATLSAGLLVGNNSADITNSRVEGDLSIATSTLIADGTIGGFAAINGGTITSSYVRNITVENTARDAINESKSTAGFVAINKEDARLSYSYAESANLIDTPDITSSGSAAGFVHTNMGDVTDTYSAISVKAALSAGFVYENKLTGSITNTYSKSEVPENNAWHMPFTGISNENNIQNEGEIYHCYYLSGNYLGEEYGDPATSKSMTEFKSGDTLDGFTSTAVSESVGVGIWKFNSLNTPTLISANAIKNPEMEISSTRMEGDTVESYIYSSTTGYDKDNAGGMDNPLIIDSADELVTEFMAIAGSSDDTYATYIRIIKDIDMSEVFGSEKLKDLNKSSFAGIIDGNGMIINNLSVLADVTSDEENFGLFESITEIKGETEEDAIPSVIINLTITVDEVSGTNVESVGALAGKISDTIIYNTSIESISDGAITGKNVAGGLAGIIENCELDNITSNIDVNAVYRTTAPDGDGDDYDYGLDYKYYDDAGVNLAEISYAGGIAGIIKSDITDDLTNKIKRLKVYGEDLNIKAEVAGGVAGYVSAGVNAYDLRYVVTEELYSSQSIIGYNITGGVIGINAGNLDHTKITYTDEYQEILDDKPFGEEKGYQELFVEQVSEYFEGERVNINIIGGLVGYNVASVSAYNDDGDTTYLQYGKIQRSYSKVDVVSDYGIIAGGLIGVNAGDVYRDEAMVTDAVLLNQVYTTSSVRVGHMYYDNILEQEIYGKAIIGGFIGKQLVDDMMGIYTAANGYEAKANEEVVLVDILTLNNWTTEDYAHNTADSMQVEYTNADIKYGALVGETEQTINIANEYVYITNDLYDANNLTGNTVEIANISAASGFAGTLLDGTSTVKDSFGLDDLTDVTLRVELLTDPYANWPMEFWEVDEYAELIYGNFGSNIITNETDLYDYIKSNPYGDFIIANDIYLSENWTPISKFLGTLRGKAIEEYDVDDNLISSRYPTIYNLNIETNSINTGFIGNISDATLSSFNIVVGGQIPDPNDGGWAWSGDYANGIITTSTERGATVGGVAGKSKNSSIENMQVTYVAGSQIVSSAEYTGGVVGYALAESKIRISDIAAYEDAYYNNSIPNNYLNYVTNVIGDITVNSTDVDVNNIKVGGLVGYMNTGTLNYNLESIGKITIGGVTTEINALAVGGVAGKLEAVEIEQHALILEKIDTITSGGIYVETTNSVDNLVTVGGIFGDASNLEVKNINNGVSEINGLKLKVTMDAGASELIEIERASILTVGGVVGRLVSNASVKLTQSSFEGDIIISNALTTNVGGLVGALYNCDIADVSFANANITINQTDNELKAGGLVGKIDELETISNSSIISQTYAVGSITNTGNGSDANNDIYIGGLIGENAYGVVSESFAQNNITSEGTGGYIYVGGLIGISAGEVSDSYSAQVIIVETTKSGSVVFNGVGGLIGTAGSMDNPNLSVENCYTVSTIFTNRTLSGNLGALIGSGDENNITDSYYVDETSGLNGQTTEIGNDGEYKVYGTEKPAIELMNSNILTSIPWGNMASDYIYPTLNAFGLDVQNAGSDAITYEANTGKLMAPLQVTNVSQITDRTAAEADGQEYISYIQTADITFASTETESIDLGKTIYNGNDFKIANDNDTYYIFNVEQDSLLSKTVAEITSKRTLVNSNNGTMYKTGAFGSAIASMENSQTIIGLAYSNNGYLFESYANVNIDMSTCTGTNTAAGLVHTNTGAIWGSFAGGEVTYDANTEVFLLSKSNTGSISESYSGIVYIGTTGAASWVTIGNSADNFHYDVYGVSVGVSTSGAKGKTTKEIRSIYTNDNNEIWVTTPDDSKNYGYPSLDWINGQYLLSTGNGTSGAAFEIPHAGKLEWLSDNVGAYNSQYFIQTHNINMASYNDVNSITKINSNTFTPIGNSTDKFRGYYTTLSNNIIDSLIINGSSYAGLFGYIDGAHISNLILQDADVSGTNYVGGIAGYMVSGSIENCENYASGVGDARIEATGSHAGGIVGFIITKSLTSFDASIDNCTNSSFVSITTASNVGGIVGYIEADNDEYIEVINSTNSGNIYTTSGSNAGGIVGKAEKATSGSNVYIENCTNYGGVNTDSGNYLGGIIGMADFDSAGSLIQNCTNTANINEENSSYIGGIAGMASYMDIVISEDLIANSGNITGKDYIGGLAGAIVSSNIMGTSSYNVKNTGIINGEKYVAGVVGFIFQGNIIYARNDSSGDITASYYVGGVAGYAADTPINNSANAGSIVVENYSTTETTEIIIIDIGLMEIGGEGGELIHEIVYEEETIEEYAGGIVGYFNSSSNNITNCINEATGTIIGDRKVGGIVGLLARGQVIDSNNQANITASSEYSERIGGIVGQAGSLEDGVYHAGVVKESDNAGDITGRYAGDSKNNIGGIVGYILHGHVEGISTNYVENSGRVQGNTSVGGIIGNVDRMSGNIRYAKNLANVNSYGTVASKVGGIVGSFNSNIGDTWYINNCINGTLNDTTHKITGTGNYVGGIVGMSYIDITASLNYLQIEAEDSCVGGIAGWTDTRIENVDNRGAVSSTKSGSGYVGGIVGKTKGELTGCTNRGAVVNNDSSYTGGIAGYVDYNTSGKSITNCYNNTFGLVSGKDHTGGLIGKAILNATSVITQSHNSGRVSGEDYVGGLVGEMSEGLIERGTASFTYVNLGNVTGTNNYVGGIVGRMYNNAVIGDSSYVIYNIGNISGDKYVGGIAGDLYYSDIQGGSSNKVQNTGTITGSDYYVGGIAGYAEGEWLSAGVYPDPDYVDYAAIKYVKNTGDVNGSSNYVGGILGEAVKYVLITYAENTSTASVDGNSSFTAGIVGKMTLSKVHYSTNDGPIDGNSYTAGIAGYIVDSEVSGGTIDGYIENTGTITCTSYSGGIVGKTENSVVSNNITNSGDVNGSSSYIGGIVGNATSDTIISDCENDTGATIDGDGQYTGGIVGNMSSGMIDSCINKGAVDGQSNYTGGIVGYIAAAVLMDSANYGNITGHSDYAAGIVGYVLNMNLNNLDNYGDVSGTSYVGGVVGRIKSENLCRTVTNSDNQGTVDGTNNIGGVIGYMHSIDVSSSINYSAGTVTATGSDVGGIVGEADAYCNVTSSSNYADITGVNNIGGIVGKLGFTSYEPPKLGNLWTESYTGSTVTNSTNATGAVITGNDDVGQIAGEHGETDAPVTKAYSGCTLNGSVVTT